MMQTVWGIGRLTHLQLWRTRVPALIVACVLFGLVLPLYSGKANDSASPTFLLVRTAGSSACFSVLWFVALGMFSLERSQGSLSLVTTRPISAVAYLIGRYLGVILLYSESFAIILLILILARLFGHIDVTTTCVAFWLFHFVSSAAQIMVAVVAGALFSQGVALFFLGLFYLFVGWFPTLFFGDQHWFLNGAAHVAYYLAPYNGPLWQAASLRQAEPLTLDTVKWLVFAGVDHLLYASCFLVVAGLFFRGRCEKMTLGK